MWSLHTMLQGIVQFLHAVLGWLHSVTPQRPPRERVTTYAGSLSTAQRLRAHHSPPTALAPLCAVCTACLSLTLCRVHSLSSVIPRLPSHKI